MKTVMSKSDYKIKNVEKSQCLDLLKNYHYLSKTEGNKGFKTGQNYGLFNKDMDIVGLCIFTGLPVPEIAKGMYGLDRNEQRGIWELSRFVLRPDVQQEEHNAASWFLSRCLRLLKKSVLVRSVLSYADCSEHTGTIYAACNFKFYGKSAPKKDFWIKKSDLFNNDVFEKHKRGKVKGLEGEWRPRTQKLRFAITYDKALKILWKEMKWGTV